MTDLIALMKNQGPILFVMVFCAYIIRLVLTHFIEKDKEVDEEFMCVIEKNTQAFHDLKDTMIVLRSKMENVEKTTEKYQDGTTQILQLIKSQRG